MILKQLNNDRIFQNINFGFLQKKLRHTGLEWHEDEFKALFLLLFAFKKNKQKKTIVQQTVNCEKKEGSAITLKYIYFNLSEFSELWVSVKSCS